MSAPTQKDAEPGADWRALRESLARLRLGLLNMSGLIGEWAATIAESASAASGAAPPRVEYVEMDPALRRYRLLVAPDPDADVIDAAPGSDGRPRAD